MLEKYGEDSSKHPLVDSTTWVELLGSKKRRVFGTMATSSSKVIGHPSHTSISTQEVIKEVVNVAMTSFVDDSLMPMLEPIICFFGGSQAKAAEEDHEDS
ncbi:hypothetical protein GLYMA_18G126951v4 [Glycine max]|nr:hypothetical protein GLYMA_18G126951v4 [Glycine max]KAH1154292.1 hypothetical protein GYH30_049804 [Glycine max]